MNAELIDKLMTKGVDYIIESPTLLFTAAVCMLTGHLLFFVILTYGSDKADSKTYLNGKFGKLALGMLWHSFVVLPVYWLHSKEFAIDYGKLIEILPTSLVIGLFIQAIFTAIYISCRKGGE